jgi:hypothetical protein
VVNRKTICLFLFFRFAQQPKQNLGNFLIASYILKRIKRKKMNILALALYSAFLVQSNIKIKLKMLKISFISYVIRSVYITVKLLK